MAQTTELKEATPLYKPNPKEWSKNGIYFFLNGSEPNWISTDDRGAKIMSWVDGHKSFGDLIQLYSQTYKVDHAKSWLDCHTFLREALKTGILSTEQVPQTPYLGRNHYLETEKLKELWIHLTQSCNLSCSHCLVSSSPQGEKGFDTDFYRRIITESSALGVERYYFTGGEPFVRADTFELIRLITEKHNKELIILTNATLFNETRTKELQNLDREKLKFQVSLDGVSEKTNDAIRGKGVFEKTSQGIKTLTPMGFDVSLTAVATKQNLTELKDLPRLAKELGTKSVHLMWPHKRGRILETTPEAFPSISELSTLVSDVQTACKETGVLFDNMESLKIRVNAQPGIKHDLGMMGWESLCVYMDGEVYPSAAMAGHKNLSFGHLKNQNLKDIWLQSEKAASIRKVSVIQKEGLKEDPFKYITGGGDIEHSYFFSTNGKEGSFQSGDPYYPLYISMIERIMEDLSLTKKNALNRKSGFNAPTVLHAMGEDSVTCSEDAMGWIASGQLPKVRLLHSNYVLAFDIDKPYKAIQKFYGKAAEKPQEELCCPVKYDDSDIGHISQEVIDRFYGCGSPISMAQVKEGETTLDLGSGAGIDCFISAKKVGPSGHVIGVDMTDPMLEVANRCKPTVAANLGYDAVEFKKGYLEKIPVQDRSVDLVTSNCVINLSPNKKQVFSEIWRILKDTGRLVVADIVSDQPVPLSLQAHQDLWGECISGSLSESEFISQLEKAGFYGISLIKKTFWKEVEGVRFYSITVRGYKFEKKAGCQFIGQKAIYLGPYKATIDEEGHLFPRGVSIEICTDTAQKLKNRPYAEHFQIIEEGLMSQIQIEPEESCCGQSSCC